MQLHKVNFSQSNNFEAVYCKQRQTYLNKKTIRARSTFNTKSSTTKYQSIKPLLQVVAVDR